MSVARDLEVIPERCYQRSLIRGIGLVAGELILYGFAIWALVVSGLFGLGHDAAHGA